MSEHLVTIEEGVPLPLAGSKQVNLLVGMKVGDSIRLPYSRRNSVSWLIKYHQAVRAPEEQFTRRVLKDENGSKYIRIWRTA